MTFFKAILIFLGTVSLILAVIGIFVPGLPTTPFVLLSAGLYIRSSEKLYNALISSYRFNQKISIELAVERGFFSKLNIWHLNMGPKFEFKKIGMFTPYAKGSLVIGHLDWDDVPGDFDTSLGLEVGFGAFFTKSKLQIGLETSYRSMKYDYNRPSGDSVTATDSQLDFSGFALSAMVMTQKPDSWSLLIASLILGTLLTLLA